MTARLRPAAIAALVLWVLCGAYATQFVYRGWIAHDEGTIGQSAARVLEGDMPHRDFDEVYTGGLTYLHAAGMKAFGVSLRAPRLVVFVFYMAFLAAVYAIGRRVSSERGGLVAMALSAVWSLPNYFVSLPSWYNLFFATFGILSFLRYLENPRRRWLVAAGLCGGLSVLAKISGVFYLAGGLLFLAYLAQNQALDRPGKRPARPTFWLLIAVPIVVFLLMLIRKLPSGDTISAAMELFLPAAIVSLLVAWREWVTRPPGSFAERVRGLFTLTWPFLAGAALPLLAYVFYFWRADAVAELIQGLFILPQRRLVEAASNSRKIAAYGLGVPYAVLLLAGWRRAVPREAVVAGSVAVFLGVALALANEPLMYRAIWAAALTTTAVAVVAIAAIVAERPGFTHLISARAQTQLFLLVTMAAMVALVQFPYATPIYFCYGAPLTFLSIIAIVFAQPKASRRSHLVVAAFLFLFAVIFVNRSYGWNLGVKFLPYSPSSRLDVPRGGLLVPEQDKETYEEVVRVLQEHAAGGTIYAGPDCPEIYFLSGFSNPTRAVFDFLTPTRQDELWMTNLISDASIRAVVINTAPLFSPRLEPGVTALLERRFPRSQRVGRFLVRFE